MAKINPALFERLQKKLGVGAKAVYRQIQDANTHLLETHLAALAFARANGIGITRYSTAEEREELRAALGARVHLGGVTPIAPSIASTEHRRKTKSFPASRKSKKDGSVFVVHGRNEKLRKSMFEFLRCIGLKPMEWEKAVLKAKGPNPYVADILRKAMEEVHVIIVLLTPDDEAKLKEEFCKRGEKTTEGKLHGQPRPNVLFEAGWALGGFPNKTLLVQVGKLRGFSDIGGKHMLHLTNDAAKRNAFTARLKKFGCKLDLDGEDWTKTGDFKI